MSTAARKKSLAADARWPSCVPSHPIVSDLQFAHKPDIGAMRLSAREMSRYAPVQRVGQLIGPLPIIERLPQLEARASGSSGGTSRALAPCSRISGIPPTEVATTGQRNIPASSSATPKLRARGRQNSCRRAVVGVQMRMRQLAAEATTWSDTPIRAASSRSAPPMPRSAPTSANMSRPHADAEATRTHAAECPGPSCARRTRRSG